VAKRKPQIENQATQQVPLPANPKTPQQHQKNIFVF
jgi:hypothetical protein